MKPQDEALLAKCEVQTYKARGKGGQHVQKTESAVRLIHLPTGLRVTSEQERSQYLNRKICLEKLKKKLVERAKKRKKRIPTKKPKAAKEKILKEKKLQSEKKEKRRPPTSSSEL
jgi:protein subunit release factor B